MQVIPDNIDFSKYLQNREGDCVRPASEWHAAVVDRFSGKEQQSGFPLPWSKTHANVALRPGEVTIAAGINGHGKSMLTGQIALWLLPEAKTVIASMEMPPAATLQRMIRQASGTAAPARSFIDGFLSWTDGRLWIYDQQDSVPTDRILGMTVYAAEVLEADILIIDSLMKCGIGTDDYNAQKNFVDRLCWLAKGSGLHIVLIAHMRKGENEHRRPDKFDIRGAAEITDLVDNVFIVHRNKAKEEDARVGRARDPGEPDATLNVAKQRHGEWEGIVNLWYHGASQQFVPDKAGRVMCWGVDVIGDLMQ